MIAIPARGPAVTVRVEPTIANLDAAAWDAVVPDGAPLSKHRFVRLCEDAAIAGARYRHALLTDGRGPLAIASYCAFAVELDALAGRATRIPARALRRLAPGFLRPTVLFGGLPPSLGRSCLRLRAGVDAATADAAVATLAEVAEDAAVEFGAPLVCFKEFGDDERPVSDRLEAHGYLREPSLPGCTLALSGGSFDDWIAAMRSGYRHQVRATARAGERAGIRLRVEPDFAPWCTHMHALYDTLMDDVEVRIERLPQAFFTGLAASFRGHCRTVLAEHDGNLVGFALLLVAGHTGHFLLTGFDRGADPAAALYPNLVTHVVEAALEAGCTSLELGQTSYAMKQRLGGVPAPRWIYLRGRSFPARTLLRAGGPVLFPQRPLAPRRVFHHS